MKGNKLRLFSFFIVLYMLLAFIWWSVLLFNQNRDTFEAKNTALKLSKVVEGTYISEADYTSSLDYLELKRKYERRERMIYGETIVIMLSIAVGFLLINRGYRVLYKGEKAKKNFLLSVSHELKSPIASMQLAFETIGKRNLSESQRDQIIGQGLEESTRLQKLVNNILMAARMETGYEPIRSNINFVEILKKIEGIIQTQFPRAKLTCEVIPENLKVKADPIAVEATLVNLVENAAKYSKEDPKIHIRIFADEKLNLFISDNGIGIPVKERKRIFEKFYRLGTENIRRSDGTGLGLYLVDHLIKLNGGTIAIKENKPTGSVFHVSIPL